MPMIVWSVGKFENIINDGRCNILNALCLSTDAALSISEVGLNFRLVTLVTRFFTIFRGVGFLSSNTDFMSYRLTIPCALPVATNWPLGDTASDMQDKLPSSMARLMHVRVFKSHIYISLPSAIWIIKKKFNISIFGNLVGRFCTSLLTTVRDKCFTIWCEC